LKQKRGCDKIVQRENERVCCFCGHRPNKFPWGRNELDPRCIYLKSKIADAVEQAIEDGFSSFITGGAIGTDMWCAECVMEAKLRYPKKDIRLILAIPFLDYARYFSDEEKHRLSLIIDASDERIITSCENDMTCVTAKYYKRNEYMVDNSSRLIAVYNANLRGGTRYTVEYARKCGIEIIFVNWRNNHKGE